MYDIHLHKTDQIKKNLDFFQENFEYVAHHL